jgi:DNA-binding transcriptional MerR regulator
MDLFSISQLAQFSGIKAHTIRMWEQRYNALSPQRSEGNTRYYDNSQLMRLLNIVSLMDEGYKVSELCRLSDSELAQRLKEVEDHNAPQNPEEYYISQLVAAGMNYDEWHFEKVFSHCVLRMGMKQAYLKVLYPMISRMGLMWAQTEFLPGHEHFISNIIRQKFFTALDALPPIMEEGKNWLLFLPENEFHELGLLHAHYLIRATGRKSFYLGANMPLESLASSVKQIQPDNLLLFMVHNETLEKAQAYLDHLSDLFPQQNIHVSGKTDLLRNLRFQPPVYWLEGPENLEKILI